MSTILKIALLVFIAWFSGCASETRELESSRKTISRLQAEVKALKAKTAALSAHEEMAIGEIAFAQGCALWVNTCFGREAIGKELIAQGLSAQGTYQFFLWMASKIVLLSLALTALGGSSLLIMNRLIHPSAENLRKAQSIIDQADQLRLEIEQSKARSLTELRQAESSVLHDAQLAMQRLMSIRSDISIYTSECDRLQSVIAGLQHEVAALELAKAAASAFTRTRR